MKRILVAILLSATPKLLSQQSTTGPVPPPRMEKGITTRTATQTVIANVPAYLWHHGCGPTAVGMVVGYWDTTGFPNLIPGSGTTQNDGVDSAIANAEHYNDYSLPIDYSPNLLPDKSSLGGAHTSNCIADFMETSWSLVYNYYGWSWSSDVHTSFTQYVHYVDENYFGLTYDCYYSSTSWDRYRNEIDNHRPVVLLVDSNGDGSTDHFVTGIGYDDTTKTYGVLNTWDQNVHWYPWHGLTSGNAWGIYGFTAFDIVHDANEQIVQLISPNGKEEWTADSDRNIIWTTFNVGNVAIDYTTDNGNSWTEIVSSLRADAGSYKWTIPFAPSRRCKIRIRDAEDGDPADVSDSTFTIEALPPTILSFSPPNGPAGTSVSISGMNFGLTPADNIVFFGAVSGTVTSVRRLVLTATVPPGATFAPVSVTTNGFTACARLPFVVAPLSSGPIDSTLFPSRVDLNISRPPHTLTLVDIDGDFKPDVITTDSSDGTVTAFLNTSIKGFMTVESFAEGIHFPVGLHPEGMAVADIDGDGKPDVVVANGPGNTLTLLRNTSTQGNITQGSFVATVDLETGDYPKGVAVGDFDGDGRPDIASPNKNSHDVSVFRNTGVSGSLSFNTREDYATGSQPEELAVADIDGDGKVDLVVAVNNPGSLTVLRNTSTVGNISFAQKQAFPAGNFIRCLAIGDIDGDGNPDAVTTDSGKVSVHRNMSTPGTISFAGKVDCVTGSLVSAIALGDLDGDGRPDLAAADYTDNKVVAMRNTSTTGMISFMEPVAFAVGHGPSSMVIGDLDGDDWPDLATANTLGSGISFLTNTVVAPTLASPSNKSTDQPMLTTLTWNMVATATSYHVQVSTDSFFAVIVVDDSAIVGTSMQIGPLRSLTKYYWRVRVKSPTTGPFSQAWVFTTLPSLTAPDLVRPANNAVDQELGITFAWKRTSGAVSFRFELGTDTAFAGGLVIADSTIADTVRTVDGLSPGTKYYWRVRGTFTSSTAGPFSLIWSFTTKTLPPAQVILVSPPQGAVLLSDTVRFVWRRSPGVMRYCLEYAFDSTFALCQMDSMLIDTTHIVHLQNHEAYCWKVRACNAGGWGEFSGMRKFSVNFTDVNDEVSVVPTEFSLSQNYPNPFNPSTTIRFQLPRKTCVSLKIFDLLGRTMAVLVEGYEEPGYKSVRFDASSLASGVYICRIQAGDFIQTRKLLLLR